MLSDLPQVTLAAADPGLDPGRFCSRTQARSLPLHASFLCAISPAVVSPLHMKTPEAQRGKVGALLGPDGRGRIRIMGSTCWFPSSIVASFMASRGPIPQGNHLSLERTLPSGSW